MHRFKSLSAFSAVGRSYFPQETGQPWIKPVSMTSSSPAHAKSAGRSILVVDDEISILQCVRQILEFFNYTVTTSPSGDQAWEAIERGQVKTDLVLTDIVMPGSIDGLTLAAKIRQREQTLPVLFLTGAILEDAGYAAEIAGKKLLLRKPFSPKQLVDFIDWHFAQNELGVGAARP
jgi:CheY-like chemotaxis protein